MRSTTRIIRTIALLGVLLLGACASQGGKQDGGRQPAMQQAKALQTAMRALSQLANEQNYASMGFESLKDVGRAEAGTPVEQRTLGFESMLGFQGGFPLEDLLEPQVEVIYPIEVDGRLMSSLSLNKNASAWSIAAIADRSKLDALTMAREHQAGGVRVEILSAPGVNVETIKLTENGRSSVIAVRDYPRLGWTKGMVMEWSVAVLAIVEYANALNAEFGREIHERRLTR